MRVAKMNEREKTAYHSGGNSLKVKVLYVRDSPACPVERRKWTAKRARPRRPSAMPIEPSFFVNDLGAAEREPRYWASSLMPELLCCPRGFSARVKYKQAWKPFCAHRFDNVCALRWLFGRSSFVSHSYSVALDPSRWTLANAVPLFKWSKSDDVNSISSHQ